MNLQALSEDNNMSKRGFSLIELILVIALIGIIATGAASFGSNFLTRVHLQNTEKQLVHFLRTAQINALAGKEGGNWGVYVGSGQATLFNGVSYALRNTEFDESYAIPQSISVSSHEIVYSAPLGLVDNVANIVINSALGTAQLNINNQGIVDVN